MVVGCSGQPSLLDGVPGPDPRFALYKLKDRAYCKRVEEWTAANRQQRTVRTGLLMQALCVQQSARSKLFNRQQAYQAERQPLAVVTLQHGTVKRQVEKMVPTLH